MQSVTQPPPATDAEHRAAAYHEAGHAVAAIAFGYVLKAVSIARETVYELHGMACPDGLMRSGYVDHYVPRPEPKKGDRIGGKHGRQLSVICLAGPEAERYATGESSNEGSDMWWMICHPRFRGTFNTFVDGVRSEAARLVIDQWGQVRALAEALLEHETLDYRQAIEAYNAGLDASLEDLQ